MQKLARGSAATAVEHLEAAVALAAGNAEVSLRLTLAEARLIAGQPREAIAVLEGLMADVDMMDNGEQAHALRLIDWAHFTLGAHARAEASFREASVERVRTLLDYGSFLRHHGRPAVARPVLAEAVERAEALGAGWLAAGAKGELGAAGGRRRRPVGGRRALTPSEERVARLATGGASNETIAKQLSISVRTVETHLQHAYAKLGIRSRRQLMAKTRASADRSSRVG